MAAVPPALIEYMEGLRHHDIDRIGCSLASELKFVTPVRAMDKAQTLAFLSALYTAFPDWKYDNDAPVLKANGSWAVVWRQGGTHTETLAFPGFPAVAATGKSVRIPEHPFFYRVAELLTEIRPEPVPGGAPRGIFEQIGVPLPPL